MKKYWIPAAKYLIPIMIVLFVYLLSWSQSTVVLTGNINVGSSAEIDWLAASGATSYNVYRGDTPGGPYGQIMSGLTSLSYVDSAVNLSVNQYCYVVTAVNFGGESSFSNEDCTPLIETAPQLVSIDVIPVTDWIGVLASDQFTALGTYDDGSVVDFTNTCAWISSNIGIATINGAGLARGVAVNASPANITCTVGSVTSAISHLYVTSVSITTTTLPDAMQGTAYSQTLAATGGTPSYTWSVDTLPDGLVLNSSTGNISGTPTTLGSTSFTAIATDTNGLQDGQALSINVVAGTGLVLQTTGFPQASAGGTYSFVQQATGGSGDYTGGAAACTKLTGTLPTTVAISTNAAGCLYQTSTTVTAALGTYSGTTRITDSVGHTATAAFSIQVVNGPPTGYTSPTDTLIHNITLPPPNVGGLQTGSGSGSRCYTDPYTGNRVMRITDALTLGDASQNFSASPGDGIPISFNGDDSMIEATVSGTGAKAIIPFDPVACTVGTAFKMPTGAYHWSLHTPNLTYKLFNTTVDKCTVDSVAKTVTCVPYFDFSHNPGNGYTSSAGGLLPNFQPVRVDGIDQDVTETVFGADFGAGPPWSQRPADGTGTATWPANAMIVPDDGSCSNNSAISCTAATVNRQCGSGNTCNLFNAGNYSFRNITSSADGGVTGTGTCVGGSSEPTSWNQTSGGTVTAPSGTTADGTCTWANIGPHRIQDGGLDEVIYDSANNCFIYIDVGTQRVQSTDCSGQPTGRLLNYGNPATPLKGLHGGGLSANPNYGQYTDNQSPLSFFKRGSLQSDHCTVACTGHQGRGYTGIYKSGGKLQKHLYDDPNGTLGPALWTYTKSDYHTSYWNVTLTDSTPIAIMTTNHGFGLGNVAGKSLTNYSSIYEAEFIAVKTDGSSNNATCDCHGAAQCGGRSGVGTCGAYRFFNLYSAGNSLDFGANNNEGAIAQTGKYGIVESDRFGMLGSNIGGAITTITQSGTTVTVTASRNLNAKIVNGAKINVIGVPVSGYNGKFTVTVTGATTFTYTTTAGLSASSTGGFSMDTCVSGSPGCATSPAGETCVIGPNYWGQAVTYPLNAAVIGGTGGIGGAGPGLATNANGSVYKTSAGTSTTTVPIWGNAQTTGSSVTQDGVTYTNVGQLDCRFDLFVGTLN